MKHAHNINATKDAYAYGQNNESCLLKLEVVGIDANSVYNVKFKELKIMDSSDECD